MVPRALALACLLCLGMLPLRAGGVIDAGITYLTASSVYVVNDLIDNRANK